MYNLLSAYFTKLCKDKLFWLIECVIVLWASYVFWHARQQFVYGMHHVNEVFHTNPYFFNVSIWLGISLALYSAYFTGTEYHDGVLRNQIISGHRRSVIYLSHYLLILLTGIMQAAAYYLVFIIADSFFLGFSVIHMLVKPAEYILLIFLALLGYSAVFSFFSILLANKSAAVFVQLLLAILMLYFGFATVTSLQEPETVVTNTSYGEHRRIPNPKYLTGTKREVYEWADAFLPSSLILHGVMTDKNGIMTDKKDGAPFHVKIPVGAALLTVCFTAFGLYGFSRKDLK